MHDTQTVAVLVMCALESEYQIVLSPGNLDSSSTLAHEVMLTHLCARNFGHHYWLEEIEVVSFSNVSRLHLLSCLVHKFLCLLPNIYDNLNCIH